MPGKDITNPAVIQFLIENYEKEKRLRLKWLHKNRDKVHEAAALKRKPTNYYERDVDKYNMTEGLAALTKGHMVAHRNRIKLPVRDGTYVRGIKYIRHRYSIVDLGLGDAKDDPRLARPDTDLSVDPIMRPVDPKLTHIIYKPKPEFGRQVYLDKRTKVLPERKYYLTQCSNWEYGWRMSDSRLKQTPQYGRYRALSRGQQTRVGPQPDPNYYKSADRPRPSKCP